MILAGGEGARLWPLAGRTPKPFLLLDHGVSLFRRAYERIAPLVDPARVLVVTSRADVVRVRLQAPEIPLRQILAEEVGRDTAASVALAALRLRHGGGDAVMAVLPADHFIRPAPVFRSVMRTAFEAARATDGLVTIGIRPRSPEPGFGYLRPGRREIVPGVRRVESFIEKPVASRAARMVRSGRYLWNSGIFVWKASSILKALERHRPDIVRPLARWARRARPGTTRVPAGILRRIPRSSIDRAVLERSRSVFVIRAPFEWSDLGNWDAITGVLRRDSRGNAGIGRIIAVDSRRCVGANAGGLTVFLGVRDIVAARSGDVVLVCHRRMAQRVREIVRGLKGSLSAYR